MLAVCRCAGAPREQPSDKIHPAGRAARCREEDAGARRLPGDRRHAVRSFPHEHHGKVSREAWPQHDDAHGV